MDHHQHTQINSDQQSFFIATTTISRDEVSLGCLHLLSLSLSFLVATLPFVAPKLSHGRVATLDWMHPLA